MKKILKSTNGSGYVNAVILMMVILIIFSVVMTISEVITNAKRVEKDAQITADAFSALNTQAINEKLRDFSTKSNDKLEFDDLINEAAIERVKTMLCNTLDLRNEDTKLVKYNSENSVDYYISNIEIGSVLDTDKTLSFFVELDLNLPVYFMGELNVTPKIHIIAYGNTTFSLRNVDI